LSATCILFLAEKAIQFYPSTVIMVMNLFPNDQTLTLFRCRLC